MAYTKKETSTPEVEVKPTNQVESSKEATVSVPQGLLERIQGELSDLRKQNELLMAISDKTQLARFYEKNQGKLAKIVKLWSWLVDGAAKVIIFSEMTQNAVYKDQFGRWHEEQSVKLIFQDGTGLETDYKSFVNLCRKDIKAKVISRAVNVENDKVIFKVERLDTGEVLDIEDMFVN